MTAFMSVGVHLHRSDSPVEQHRHRQHGQQQAAGHRILTPGFPQDVNLQPPPQIPHVRQNTCHPASGASETQGDTFARASWRLENTSMCSNTEAETLTVAEV